MIAVIKDCRHLEKQTYETMANQMTDPENQVTTHYQKRFSKQTIEDKIAEIRMKRKNLTLDDLALLDDLHVGGRDFTRQLGEVSGLQAGDLVLDVGSGIGGPVRIIASEFQCRVVGVDLSEPFSRVARLLSETVGTKECRGFIVGDALKLPFPDNCFDGVWNQHCSMNIPDKKTLYSEIHRVLKPGGKLAIHDILQGDNCNLNFPVPWAESKQVSFLLPAAEHKSTILASGFNCLRWNDISQNALSWFDKPRNSERPVSSYPFNQKMIFGDQLKAMARNMKKNLSEQNVCIIEAVFQTAT